MKYSSTLNKEKKFGDITKIKFRKVEGITLIALVITIIVLLILAGVAISMLSGDNGILKKAVEAKESTEDAQVREQIQLAVASARMLNNGDLTEEALDAELKNTFGEGNYTLTKETDEEGNQIGFLVKVGNVEERIEEEKAAGPKVITADDIYSTQASYYGKKVDYKIDIDGDGETADDWEIFYVEDYQGETDASPNMINKPENGKRIFLIASDYVGNSCEALTNKSSTGGIQKSGMTQDSTDDCCYYWESGPSYSCITPKNANGTNACTFPSLFEFTHYDIESNNSKTNSKCAASLLCTGNWSSFAKDGIAEYAIGGPTVEMWCDSWNKYYNNLDSGNKKLFREVYANGNGENGYYIGDSEEQTSTYDYYVTSNNKDFIDTDGANAKNAVSKLYFPHPGESKEICDLDGDKYKETCYGYWLASPSKYTNDYMIFVESGGRVGEEACEGGYGVRPVVCLESDIQLVESADGYTIGN